MEYPSLRAAAHVPPDEWDPARDGPWRCQHCNAFVFSTWAEFHRGKEALDALKAAADDGDKAARAKYDT
eukprot:5733446-Pleurochrysis_carterae.AAC.1